MYSPQNTQHGLKLICWRWHAKVLTSGNSVFYFFSYIQGKKKETLHLVKQLLHRFWKNSNSYWTLKKRNVLRCTVVMKFNCYVKLTYVTQENGYQQPVRCCINSHSISIIILLLQLNKLCHNIITYCDPLKTKWMLISTFSGTCRVSVTKQCLNFKFLFRITALTTTVTVQGLHEASNCILSPIDKLDILWRAPSYTGWSFLPCVNK